MTVIAKVLNDSGAHRCATFASHATAMNGERVDTTPIPQQFFQPQAQNRPAAQLGVDAQARIDAEWRARETSSVIGAARLHDTRANNSPQSNSSLATPIKKKRGFFSRLGGALKKFAQSKFGKILMIGGALAASLLIPGAGAAIGKAIATLGKSLMGGISGLATKVGVPNLLKGGLKTFIKQQILPKLGLEGGIKNALKSYLEKNLLSVDSLKSFAQSVLKKAGLEDLMSKGGLKAVLSQLGARLGISDEWLEKLLGESEDAPQTNASSSPY